MDELTKSVFLVEKIKHREKTEWLKRIITSQLGVQDVSINPSNMLMKVEYDSNAISPQAIKVLVRSVGCDLLIDEKKIHDRLKQKRRLKRDILFFVLAGILFALSFFTWNYEWGLIAVGVTGFIFLFSLVLLIIVQRRNY